MNLAMVWTFLAFGFVPAYGQATEEVLTPLSLPGKTGVLKEGRQALARGDFANALKIFRPLAEQGVAYSQAKLAAMYVAGQGVPKDLVQAHMWYSLADMQGLVLHHWLRSPGLPELESLMTPSQINEAKRLARKRAPKGK